MNLEEVLAKVEPTMDAKEFLRPSKVQKKGRKATTKDLAARNPEITIDVPEEERLTDMELIELGLKKMTKDSRARAEHDNFRRHDASPTCNTHRDLLLQTTWRQTYQLPCLLPGRPQDGAESFRRSETSRGRADLILAKIRTELGVALLHMVTTAMEL